MLQIKLHKNSYVSSFITLVLLVGSVLVISKYDFVYALPPILIPTVIKAPCGFRGTDNLTVECGLEFVCTSNEYNTASTRICLRAVGDKCKDNTECEGGSFCDVKVAGQSGICAITSESEQATAADLRDTIRRAINIFLGFLGILTVILVLYGGFVWLTAAGSEDHVKKGRDILLWAAIGAIVISIAWTISSYILNVAQKVG